MKRKQFDFFGCDGITIVASSRTAARALADAQMARTLSHAARNRTRVHASVNHPGYAAVQEPLGDGGYTTYFVTPSGEIRAYCTGSYGKKADEVWAQHLAWFETWLQQESPQAQHEPQAA